jgi:hypothetical protein
MDLWYQSSGRNMRLLALGIILIALAASYLLMLRHFKISQLPKERHFGAIGPVKPAGEVYLEPIGIDALNDAMQIRAYLSPSISESKNAHTVSNRDLTLLFTHDQTVEEVKLAAADYIAYRVPGGLTVLDSTAASACCTRGQGAAAGAGAMSAVRNWLEAIGLGQYGDAFEANDIDMDLLAPIDDQLAPEVGAHGISPNGWRGLDWSDTPKPFTTMRSGSRCCRP